MIAPPSAGRRIATEVEGWDGVTSGFGKRGEFAFRFRGREIGHLHGDAAAHFFFERGLWAELKAAGRITDHPVFPGKAGPAARRIKNDGDVSDVIELMRISYEHLQDRHAGS